MNSYSSVTGHGIHAPPRYSQSTCSPAEGAIGASIMRPRATPSPPAAPPKVEWARATTRNVSNDITISFVRDEQRAAKNNQRFNYAQHGRFTIEQWPDIFDHDLVLRETSTAAIAGPRSFFCLIIFIQSLRLFCCLYIFMSYV
jgi:hypothetical protein